MLASVTIEPRSPSTGSCVEHLRDGVLGDEERAGEVDADDAVPLGLVDQVHRPAAGDTGGV